MKLITFSIGRETRLGALSNDQVVDLHKASGDSLPTDMGRFLKLGEAGLETARLVIEQALATGQTHPIGSVKIMAPILNPSKIVGIGLNYIDHCREQNIEPPQSPIIFAKFPSSIIGPGDAIRWNPELTRQVDFEAELAVVIGRLTRQVTEAEALDYVAGYMIGNDVSARDLQKSDKEWVRGKSLDTFCSLGPYLVTRDEIANPNNLAIHCTVNGEVMQNSNTSKMIFQVPFLIEYISRGITLLPGDVIMTGTPHGVGVYRSPSIFLKDGDEVSIDIEGLGRLTNGCVEE